MFDRIEKGLKHPTEDARILLKKKLLREKIQKEEEAKTKLIIEERIQDEEKKLQQKTKHIRIPSSDSEPGKESKQEQLAKALRDLKRKVEGDFEVGVVATPFTKSLEAIPREEGLKHFNFEGLGDPEEHLNYFEQISNIYY